MGWTSSYNWITKASVIEEVISNTHWGERFEVLKHSVRGSRVWVLAQHVQPEKKGQQIIVVFLIKKFNDREWGYKDIDESCGPLYYDCPLSFISSAEKAGGPLNASAQSWREDVRTFHAQQKEKRQQVSTLKSGMQLILYGVTYELLEKNSGRKGWKVRSLSDNQLYTMSAKQVGQAEQVFV